MTTDARIVQRAAVDITALRPGDVVRHVPSRTITEFDDMLVALLTVNLAPLHIDANYSSKTPHGRRIVNGLFIASIAVGLSNQDFRPDTSRPLKIDAIDHYAPTFYGNTITCASEIKAVDDDGDRATITIRTHVTNEDDQLVMTIDRALSCTISREAS